MGLVRAGRYSGSEAVHGRALLVQMLTRLETCSKATLKALYAELAPGARPARSSFAASRRLVDMVKHDGVQFCKLLPPPEACVLDKAEREEHAKLGAYAKRRKLEAAVKAGYDNASLQEEVFNKAGVSSQALPQFLRPARGR